MNKVFYFTRRTQRINSLRKQFHFEAARRQTKLHRGLFVWVCYFFLCISSISAQDKDFPVTLLGSSDTSKPVIFYISGDGGWNSFSLSLIQTLNKKGYTVAGLNAKSYFWEKKTPIQTATAISSYLTKLAARSTHGIVFAGYSFGADVLPFIVNSIPANEIRSVILLAPSTSTDFEIHWTDLLGWDKKRSMDVVAAINRMNVPRVLAVFGDDEKEFPVEKIQLRNFTHQVLPGGHHFENNIAGVAGAIISGI